MATRLKDRVEPDYRDSSAPAYQQVIAGDPRPAPPLFTEYAETDVPVRRVPRAQYTDPAFAALEQERMWSKIWQMACREEQIPEEGDCVLYEAPGASLIIVRTDGDTIKAYYNSCLLRCMKPGATDTPTREIPAATPRRHPTGTNKSARSTPSAAIATTSGGEIAV